MTIRRIGAGSARLSTDLVIERDGRDSLRLVVRGQHVAIGDDLSDRFGFDEPRLDERLLRIIVALALRRRAGGDGWMTAEELSVFALAGVSGQATSKQLEKALHDKTRVGPRLIEYRPARPSGGGRSRGPYRLGVVPGAIELDEDACWSFLAGRTLPPRAEDDDGLAHLLGDARSALHAGRLVQAQILARTALRSIYEGFDELRRAPARERYLGFAQAYALLANIDLETGTTKAGLLAAERARICFDRIKHPEGTAYALQLEAHLRGQLDGHEESRRSFDAARKALVKLDDAGRGARRGLQRAVYIGTVGLRQSRLGFTAPAAKRLLTAYRLSEAASSRTWAAIWAIRIGQNALVAGNLAIAERFMAIAHDAADTLTVSGYAALTRGMGELYLVAGQLDEAERWILRARSIGEELAMGHQRHLSDQLFDRLVKRRT